MPLDVVSWRVREIVLGESRFHEDLKVAAAGDLADPLGVGLRLHLEAIRVAARLGVVPRRDWEPYHGEPYSARCPSGATRARRTGRARRGDRGGRDDGVDR